MSRQDTDKAGILPSDTVSVVMPCYNGMPYLPQALESAISQTHRPCEIIVVDDGSKDDSAQVVEAYAARHPDANIRLIQQANAGEPAARNTGINASSGEWVAQLDTDDWWEATKLEQQLAAATEAGPDCVMVHTGGWHVNEQGERQQRKGEPTSDRVGWCTRALLGDGAIGHPSIMVRRDALAKIGGYDPEFKQACDIDLYFRLSAVGTFAFVPERLLNYRVHAGQMSASQAKQVRFHHRAIRKFFEQHPKHREDIGEDTVHNAMADHLARKIESQYWRRNLDDFRALLDYAREAGLDNEKIATWRRRGRWPDWVIRLRDRLTGRTG